MRDFLEGGLLLVIAAVVAGTAGFTIGLSAGNRMGTEKAGQVACQSINKTWALIDGQYMCVTVTE